MKVDEDHLRNRVLRALRVVGSAMAFAVWCEFQPTPPAGCDTDIEDFYEWLDKVAEINLK